MSLDEVRSRIIARLDEADRGDRGWFIITRVHVSLARLQGIAEYLERRGRGGPTVLTTDDFRALARITGSDTDDPGLQLRRHYLLVMEKPLQLLRRADDPSWRSIILTGRGGELARTDDPASVLEQSLSAVCFAREPFTTKKRAREYAAFELPVYQVTERVLRACNGYVDRNEFDFFLSRIRAEAEVNWAVDGIHSYRGLASQEQQSLHVEVRGRTRSEKRYQNWRDIALHTFSLFSLGTSMVREGQRLLLTAAWSDIYATQLAGPASHPTADAAASSNEQLPSPASHRVLRVPVPPEAATLLTPPAAPASNVGADAESFVAKILRSQGWEVAFYTTRRGYGFDLWARREQEAMVVEVKSSVGELGAVSLTALEYQAAQEYGNNYVLAIVEQIDSDNPRLWMIQNPLSKTTVQRRDTADYVIAREQWMTAARVPDI